MANTHCTGLSAACQVVPAELGFGSSGAVLRPTEHVPDKQGIVPADAELEYELELVRVSIPPS